MRSVDVWRMKNDSCSRRRRRRVLIDKKNKNGKDEVNTFPDWKACQQ